MSESFASRLRGAFIAAVPAPFDAAGTFVPVAQESYVEYMAGQPISGVALWAHTGRGLHLSEALAGELLASWRQALPERLVVAGAGAAADGVDPGTDGDAAYIRRAVAMAQRAAEGGADALLAFAPVRFRDHAERRSLIRRYHAELADVGLPVIAFFLYEAAGGVNYTLDELRDIFSLERVAGLKMATLDSVCTFQDVAALVRQEFPDRVLITGEDRFLGYSILRGAEGALVGMGAALPAFQIEMLQAWRDGRNDRFVELLQRADQFAECTFIAPMEGYIQRMLHALAELGVVPESATHDPWCDEISPLERRRVATVVRELQGLGLE